MKTFEIIEKITVSVSAILSVLFYLFILIDKKKKKSICIKKNYLVMLLSMGSFFMNSQDTIYFKDKGVLAVKVIDVEINEITYKHFDNLDGPKYHVNKKDLFFIKYSNGIADTINQNNIAVNGFKELNMYAINKNEQGLQSIGNHFKYYGHVLSERKVFQISQTHSNEDVRNKFKKEFNILKSYEINQRVTATGLFISGVALHALGWSEVSYFSRFYTGNGNNEVAVMVNTFIAGAVLRIYGHVVHAVYRNKAKAKRNEISYLFNENNL